MSEKEKSMHDGHRGRLREAADLDPDLTSFSEFQVLELFLSYMVPRKDTNPIAHELIERFGSLYGVFQASTEELKNIPNMTINAAHCISHFYSFFRKVEFSRRRPKPILSRTFEAVEVLKPYFVGRNEERVYCATLDINDKLMDVVLVGEGLADSTLVNNNKILGLMTRTKAKKIILAHNHPAGALVPSQQDIDTTRFLFSTLPTVGAVLSDHIIFGRDGYFSFYENHLLDGFILKMDQTYGTNLYQEVRSRKDSSAYLLEPKIDKEST